MIRVGDGADAVETPVIDASVHIFFGSNKDLRENFMQEPFRSRGFPDYEMDWYGAPGGESTPRAQRDPKASTRLRRRRRRPASVR